MGYREQSNKSQKTIRAPWDKKEVLALAVGAKKFGYTLKETEILLWNLACYNYQISVPNPTVDPDAPENYNQFYESHLSLWEMTEAGEEIVRKARAAVE